jgi:NAD+--asparagine ADP-ribosyltransferase
MHWRSYRATKVAASGLSCLLLRTVVAKAQPGVPTYRGRSMAKKPNPNEFDRWGPSQFESATKKHIATANEHLRKSEVYEKDYEKDHALKTVRKSIDRLKRIEHHTGNAKATRDFLNSLPMRRPKKRDRAGEKALRDFVNFMSNPMFGRRKKKGLW